MYAEDCPFKVVRTNGEDEVLARATNLLIGRAAFETAKRMYPRDLIEYRKGAQIIEKSEPQWYPRRQQGSAGHSRNCRQRSSLGLIYLVSETDEFDPNCVIGTPHSVTLSDIIPSDLKQKFVWDRVGAHTCDFSAAVRKVAQNTGAIQVTLRVVDCCG
jgi:hypothetical protein